MPSLQANRLNGGRKYIELEDNDDVLLSRQPGWRPTVFIWMCVTIIVLLVNTSLLVWSKVKSPIEIAEAYLDPLGEVSYPIPDAGDFLFQGDCKTATNIRTWTHLAINIASTVLLLASSNVMQCLSAPTRQDVDRAHAKGRHLDIGILSARNLASISRRRCVAWCLLAVSSVPLHFFYNSIVVSSLATNEVLTAVVSHDFTTAPALNTSTLDAKRPPANMTQLIDGSQAFKDAVVNGMIENLDQWESMARSLLPSNLTTNPQPMDRDLCLQTFGARIVSGYKSVAVVLSVSNTTQILDGERTTSIPYNADEVGRKRRWTCYDPNIIYHTTSAFLQNCDLACNNLEGEAYSSPDGFKLSLPADNPACLGLSSDYAGFLSGRPGGPSLLPSSGWAFEKCYAETTPDLCSVMLAPSLLGMVIAMNAIKAAVMLYTWRFLNFEPLVTVGDAVRSLLDRPDRFTAGAGPITARQIRNQRHREHQIFVTSLEHCKLECSRTWKSAKKRWAAAVSRTRWSFSVATFVILEATAISLLFSSIKNASFSESLEVGFGGIDPFFTVDYGKVTETTLQKASIVTLAMLSNLPQMIISTAAVLYYALISAMLLAAELSSFAKTRSTLRVSPPRYGKQRSTYYLTLPLRYAIPLMVSFTLLHWFISQSLFLLRVDVRGYGGEMQYAAENTLGFSPVSILAGIILGAVMIISPVLLAFKKLPDGIPLMGHNSLAISAACHPDESDPSDASERPLMYGVLPTVRPDGLRRVGFSSLEVEPLVEGTVYHVTRCAYKVVWPHDHSHGCLSRSSSEEMWSFFNYLEESARNVADGRLARGISPYGEGRPLIITNTESTHRQDYPHRQDRDDIELRNI